jgi:para-aminobenzoate synthetase component 1
MGGLHATGLQEISDDPAVLDDGNFWAVIRTFEGRQTFARFKDVIESQFPHSQWMPLVGSWRSSLYRDSYMKYVEMIRDSVAEGRVYQVNACRVLETTCSDNPGTLAPLFSQLLHRNQSPHASYFNLPDIEIASASPELFLSRNNSSIKTSPIKGTLAAGRHEFGDKDKAENLMIVDLMRNDFGRISEPGSVEVSELFRVEQHPGVAHLVSDVIGQLLDGVTWSEILEHLSPPGSVSGAPKSSALDIIATQEGDRGPYCGSLGWIHGDRCELAVGIRTFWRVRGLLSFGTGAGITWNSDAASEWDETALKAEKLIGIAGGVLNGDF